MNTSGPNKTAASFHDISIKMVNAVKNVITILIIEVDESETTSSSWFTSLESTDMI